MKEKIGESSFENTRGTLRSWAKKAGLVTLLVVSSGCDEESMEDFSPTADIREVAPQMSQAVMFEPPRNYSVELQAKMQEAREKFGETRRQIEMMKEKRENKKSE